jgi:hypothetical protein
VPVRDPIDWRNIWNRDYLEAASYKGYEQIRLLRVGQRFLANGAFAALEAPAGKSKQQ